ncbi:sigma-54-dependent Fis family transcriptional regulator [Ectothiorhodospiraceae bacterium 2226]|nr:sigma-54-dependent Fis family transcriptional regulator [Ectothiorhodospiraceae bacterium 2226]
MSAPYVLVVDDEPDIRSLLQEILEDEGYEVQTAKDAASARELRRARRPDLILLDIWMPDVDGITLLKEWVDERGPSSPVIMMSGHGTVETAVEATRLGAYDFIEKPLSLAKLLVTMERALEADRLTRENVGLKRRVQPAQEPLGRSATMQRLREQVRRVAQHDAPVLIVGEPGTGKEVVARYLHANSTRADGPFVDVGVGAVTADNAALELFGREDGERVHFGLLEQASGGTLYLNDIADMELAMQAKLVGALQARAFHRAGGTEAVPLNVRVVAATRHDLAQAVQAGTFRPDLYYHLNVVPIAVPPLRAHCEDVPELLNYYAGLYAARDHLHYRNFSVGAQNRLRNHAWPGNERELQNLVQRLLITGGDEEIAQAEVEAVLGEAPRPVAGQLGVDFRLPLREAREQFERAYLEYQLREAGGSVGKLAQAVKIERTHLYRKLRALGIDPREGKDGDK